MHFLTIVNKKITKILQNAIQIDQHQCDGMCACACPSELHCKVYTELSRQICGNHTMCMHNQSN